MRFRDKEFHATGSGDGGYDAFMQALKSIERQLGFELPKLLDYEVRIPPGGKTDALVETTIKWEGGMKTRGVHSDQLAAAIQATEHALNMIALRSAPNHTKGRGVRGKGQRLLPLTPHPLPLSLNRGAMAQLGTKKSLTLAAAKEIGNAAEAKARELNFTNSIAVIDDGGNVIYQVTMDGTQMGSINVAVQKALAALRFKRSTKLFQDMVTGDKPHMAFLPGAVPVEGGLPLFVDGQIYGAIGVSGMPSDKDGIVAQAGADLAATLR